MLCFEKTTGLADFLSKHNLYEECVSSYLDTWEMADKLLSFVNSESLRQSVGSKMQQLANAYFNMETYVGKLEEML